MIITTTSHLIVFVSDCFFSSCKKNCHQLFWLVLMHRRGAFQCSWKVFFAYMKAQILSEWQKFGWMKDLQKPSNLNDISNWYVEQPRWDLGNGIVKKNWKNNIRTIPNRDFLFALIKCFLNSLHYLSSQIFKLWNSKKNLRSFTKRSINEKKNFV